MAKLTVKQIQEAALALLAENPGGIRYSVMLHTLSDANPETPQNTIRGALHQIDLLYPEKIEKPMRGVYRPRTGDGPPKPGKKEKSVAPPQDETAYYAPFAEWLSSELDEATIARPLGGAALQGKWGTPDVVGVYKPQPSDLLQFPKEIISAEIKVDTAAPVTAFGQAVAYRLFSSKSYMVLPATTSEIDLSRVEALAMLFGVGLVTFDGKPDAPNFAIRVRAARFSPDMFYVNEFADRLKRYDQKRVNELFA